jgi:hypothetical protein
VRASFFFNGIAADVYILPLESLLPLIKPKIKHSLFYEVNSLLALVAGYHTK